MTALHADCMFDGTQFHSNALIELNVDGRIAAVAPDDAGVAAALHVGSPFILAPGFVDLQVNGGGTVLFNRETSAAGARLIAEAHARLGTTSILPTLISATRDHIATALAVAEAAVAAEIPGVRGVHVEGPFISPSRPGIHPPGNITAMTEADAAMFAAPRLGVRLLTLAPEMVAAQLLQILVGSGVVVFAGHSDVTLEQALAGYAAGITGATHLYNAMSQLGSREPGLVGATMTDTRAAAGIIVDGHHVHPATVWLAWRAMGPERLFLVSDSMPTIGSDLDHFIFDGRRMDLAGDRLTDAGGRLAGAHICMADAVRNAVRLCGLPLGDALRMATRTPADAIRLDDVGRIAPGARADFVALDADLRVRAVWQGGRRVD